MSNPSFILLQTDPSGWSNPPAGKTALGVNALGQIVTRQSDGTEAILLGTNPSLHKQTNASGGAGIAPTTPFHTEIITVTGTARSLAAVISEVNIADGWQLRILFLLPPVSGIDLQLFSNATQVAEFSSDGAVRAACFEYVFDAAAGHWVSLRETIPAFTPLS